MIFNPNPVLAGEDTELSPRLPQYFASRSHRYHGGLSDIVNALSSDVTPGRMTYAAQHQADWNAWVQRGTIVLSTDPDNKVGSEAVDGEMLVLGPRALVLLQQTLHDPWQQSVQSVRLGPP